LSFGARATIGVILALTGVYLFSQRTASPNPSFVLGCAGFLAFASITCFLPQRLRPIGGRVLAGLVGITIVFLAVAPLFGETRDATRLRSLILGVPVLVFAVTGRYPKWGVYAGAAKAMGDRLPEQQRK
jgi:hypothetical protein